MRKGKYTQISFTLRRSMTLSFFLSLFFLFKDTFRRIKTENLKNLTKSSTVGYSTVTGRCARAGRRRRSRCAFMISGAPTPDVGLWTKTAQSITTIVPQLCFHSVYPITSHVYFFLSVFKHLFILYVFISSVFRISYFLARFYSHVVRKLG